MSIQYTAPGFEPMAYDGLKCIMRKENQLK